jgi:hypothetical protein
MGDIMRRDGFVHAPNPANVFWVPKESRWSHLQANAKQPFIGKVVS